MLKLFILKLEKKDLLRQSDIETFADFIENDPNMGPFLNHTIDLVKTPITNYVKYLKKLERQKARRQGRLF